MTIMATLREERKHIMRTMNVKPVAGRLAPSAFTQLAKELDAGTLYHNSDTINLGQVTIEGIPYFMDETIQGPALFEIPAPRGGITLHRIPLEEDPAEPHMLQENPLERAFLTAMLADKIEANLEAKRRAYWDSPEMADLLNQKAILEERIATLERDWEAQDWVQQVREDIATHRDVHDGILQHMLDTGMPRIQGLYRLKISEDRIVDPVRFREAYPEIFKEIATVPVKPAEEAIGKEALEAYVTRRAKGKPKVEEIKPKKQRKGR